MSMQPPFHNAQVDIESLPDYSDLDLIPMDRNYLKSRMIGWAILSLVIVGIWLTVVLNYSDENPTKAKIIVTVIASVLILWRLIISYFGFFKKSYALRQKDVLYKSGLIWQGTTIIPFNRIQHTEVNHGPIDRFFGLASLKLFTAGGSASDLTIPGLKDHDAHRLKDFIAKKTAMDEEE